MTKEVLVKKLGDLFYLPNYRNSHYELSDSFLEPNDVKIISRRGGDSYLCISRTTIWAQSSRFYDRKGQPNNIYEMYRIMSKWDGYKLLGL